MSEPRCIEASASVSVGGKIQVVKYEYTADYFFNFSRKYEIPEGWTEQDIADFQQNKAIELREQIEPLAQTEMDELIAQRDG